MFYCILQQDKEGNVVAYFRIYVTAMFMSLSFVQVRSTFTNQHTIKLLKLISFLT